MGERKEEDGRRRGGWDVIQIVQCVSIVLQCGYYTACRGGRVQLAGGQEDTHTPTTIHSTTQRTMSYT